MKTKIIIIPGNPPARYFYEAWKKELERTVNHEVIIDYYPSFDDTTCSLEYLKKIENFYLEEVKKHEKVMLIGHSIGGHIALKILEKYSDKIDHCVLLFPFLHSPGFKAKLILGAINQINTRTFLTTRLTGLLKILSWLDKDIKKLTTHEIHSSLNFACHEHTTIGSKKIIKNNPKLNKKITVYYTHKDTWCSKKVVRNLHPELRTEFIPIKHNFVVFPAQRKIINTRLFVS